ncbi:protein argonaute MEL1-like [Wolffia australiana]
MEQQQRRGGRGRGQRGGGRGDGGGRQGGRARPQARPIGEVAEVESVSRDLQQQLTIRPAQPVVAPTVVAAPVAARSAVAPPVVAPSVAAAPVVALSEVAPSSSKSIHPLRRPGYGGVGRKIKVRTNHIPVQLSAKQIFHYDVAITPEVASKAVNMSIINELVLLYGESHLERRKVAYDRSKSLYTAGPLSFEFKEFEIELKDQPKPRKFKVVLRSAATIELTHLQMFLMGRTHDEPKETIHALDVALRQTASRMYTPVARSFFSPSLGGRAQIGEGCEYWMGFYSSLRPTQIGLSLNIDISATAFYEPILVTDFMYSYLNFRDDRSRFTDTDRLRLKKALRGVKVKVTHQRNAPRRYRVNGVTPTPAKDSIFSLTDGADRKISVADYFREQYGLQLKYAHWPCLIAGSEKKPIFLPMEVCVIVEGQRYTKKLNERQVTCLLRATCTRPGEREKRISNVVSGCKFADDQLIREFGLSVSRESSVVDARVLSPPTLQYNESGREKVCQPSMGQWNMNNKRMFEAGKVDHWAFLNLSSLREDSLNRFIHQLGVTCQQIGILFNPAPMMKFAPDLRKASLPQVLNHVHVHCSNVLKQSGRDHLKLLIVVLPERINCYGQIKKICDTSLGIVTQCCLPKNVDKCNRAYLENLSLKINVKVKGRNTVLVDAVRRQIPLVSDKPTIIIGADVTHPSPGEDSSGSIAAVVASTDWPEISRYSCLLSAQPPRQEIIADLCKSVENSMIRKHLLKFYQKVRRKPDRIIFYRDGVSEGQFNEVLLYEVDAIRKACATLEENYFPRVTFIVVQKRHHTRLFPLDNKDADRSGNVLPGTVVDTGICHPTQFDFYLCSHAGIQGTSRPTHYHVLYDENNFSADNIQSLTNKLCYTYARCTRSVSVVPPVYYAHLAAARARYYVDGISSDVDSSSGSGAATRTTAQPVAIPQVMEIVNDVMFFC